MRDDPAIETAERTGHGPHQQPADWEHDDTPMLVTAVAKLTWSCERHELGADVEAGKYSFVRAQLEQAATAMNEVTTDVDSVDVEEDR